MKTSRLLEAFGDISDEHVQGAWQFKKMKVWKFVVPVAACLVFVAGAMLLLNKPSPKLPMLSIEQQPLGMGFEGYMVYSADDIVNGNPWREDMKLATLPVYQIVGNYAVNGQQAVYDLPAMQAFAVEIAARLGFAEDEITVTDNAPTEEEIARIKEKYAAVGEEPPKYDTGASGAVVIADVIKIEVDVRMEATIRFEPAIALPAKYNFTHNASYEDIEAVGNYLMETYRGLLGMQNPVLVLYGGDFNIYGSQKYSIGFYEGSGNAEAQIVNYNLCMASFACDDEGKLFIARVRQGAPVTKLGDYPIISVKEAKTLLEQGHFITTVPAEFPGMEYVRKVELTYRGGWDITQIPYYRFYVEMPGMDIAGRMTYGAYYVPAVEGKYIENMPVWNGSFN